MLKAEVIKDLHTKPEYNWAGGFCEICKWFNVFAVQSWVLKEFTNTCFSLKYHCSVPWP